MTPFVSKAIDLYESIAQKGKLVFGTDIHDVKNIITYRCNHDRQSVDFVDPEYSHTEEDFINGLSHIQQAHLLDIKQDFLAFQNHFIDYPIVYAKEMRFLITYGHIEIATDIGIQDFTRDNVLNMAEVAERDGKGKGQIFKILLSEEETLVKANKKKSLAHMSNFYDKRNVLFFQTDNKQTHNDLTFPDYRPASLNPSLYKDLWSSIKAAKRMGIRGGSVNLYPYQGKIQFYSVLSYQDAEYGEIPCKKEPTLKQEKKLQNIGQAITNIYDEMREIAPVLKGLDRFYTRKQDKTLKAHYFINAFHWYENGCELKLFGGGAATRERDSITFFNKDEKEFQSYLEKMTGALSLIRRVPSKAWFFTMEEEAWGQNYKLTPTPIPGKDPQEALYVSLALLAGKRNYIRPGVRFDKNLFGKGYWTELAPVK